MRLSEDFTQIERKDDGFVTIYSLIPLFKEELEFKKDNGATALLELLDDYGVEEIVKNGRPNVCVYAPNKVN